KIADLIGSGRFSSAFAQLEELRRTDSTDAEFYVLTFNYYYMKSQRDYLLLGRDHPEKDSTFLMLQSDSGRPAGYLSDTTVVDLDTLRVGINVLKEGLRLYPDRLDMWFGLVEAMENSGLYNEMSSALSGMLTRHQANGGKWLWSFSQPLSEDPQQFVLENTQARISGLFEVGTELADSLGASVSEQLVTCFPNSPYGHANLGAIYLARGNYEASLSHLTQAHNIAPDDGIVIADLAELYVRTGQIDKAKQYYQELSQVGTPEERKIAVKKLKELSK
ncbi:MAG TPA: tetratricopeptide repeat protein, partial [Candidatus Acidoferrum sp.]|nr:tetratricopeptide repeat protein [Candidatus Acidoferrum sp.]